MFAHGTALKKSFVVQAIFDFWIFDVSSDAQAGFNTCYLYVGVCD